ncbi:DNA gyrase B [Nannocystis exedens]|uniref:DNA topoisomerase (ATP-hydrolyzing) n=1 Tax=Nannocystis exedens TaxID=54 RepID=A0A1I2D6K4_9BACT|nr:ATP-binding protein [Nannocystis exedens]PCC70698.1 DNA gyrase subunit B [Nannocystis exedens]SFE76167.1 DNA gyrase B [Nannocystis exedens]
MDEAGEPETLLGWVRKRPGMYVGGVHDGSGVLHVALELVANAVDQALAGRLSRLDVGVEGDETLVVSDDGPGIAADGAKDRPSLRDILERRFELPTVDGHRPHVHLGFGGIGLAVANAVAERLEIVTVHAGRQATACYCRGVPLTAMRVEATDRSSGTCIRIRADPQIFSSVCVPREDLQHRLTDLSFLLPQLRISWMGEREHHGRGLPELARLHAPATIGGVAHHRAVVGGLEEPIDVEVALVWGEGSTREATVQSFVNLGRAAEGVHREGVLDGLRSFFPRRGAAARRVGLSAAVVVVLADVQWGSPIRDKLVTPAVRPAVQAVTMTALRAWAERYPEAAARIRARGLEA